MFSLQSPQTSPEARATKKDAVSFILFLRKISVLNQKEVKQWNPVKKKFTPWIDIYQLQKMYEKEQNVDTANHPFQNNGQQQQQQQYSQPFTNVPNTRNYQQQSTTAPNYPSAYPRQQTPSQSTTPTAAAAPVAAPETAPPLDEASIKRNLLMTWALQAPAHQELKPITHLLATIQIAFPPAFGVGEHSYFQKWKALSLEGLSSGGQSVTKRAHRKAKFLLHPDKLPKDLTETQQVVCKLIWDILADAWGIYEKTICDL